MTPQRIQLRRTKGWRKPEGAVVVSRPSKWGNPYSPDNHLFSTTGTMEGPWRQATSAECVAAYRQDITCTDPWCTDVDEHPWTPSLEEIRSELGGRDLCCWCPLDQPCHADVLLKLANEPRP